MERRMLSDAVAELVRSAGGAALLLDARRGRGLLTDSGQLIDVCKKLRNAGFTRCIDYTAEHLGRQEFAMLLTLRHPAHAHCALTLKWKWIEQGVLQAAAPADIAVGATHRSPSASSAGDLSVAPTQDAGKMPAPPDDNTASLLAAYRCITQHLYVLGCEHPQERLYPQLAVDCNTSGGGAASELEPYQAFIGRLLEARTAARKAKDFARADMLRDVLAAAGLVVEDTAAGPRWEIKG
jgi:hypothetical protein